MQINRNKLFTNFLKKHFTNILILTAGLAVSSLLSVLCIAGFEVYADSKLQSVYGTSYNPRENLEDQAKEQSKFEYNSAFLEVVAVEKNTVGSITKSQFVKKSFAEAREDLEARFYLLLIVFCLVITPFLARKFPL